MDWLRLILFGLLGWALQSLGLTVFRACPKLGRRQKKRRKPIPRRSRFETFSHPFKVYKTDPPDEIRRKAEQCRAEQRAANNPVEIRFAGILNQLGVKFDPVRDFQRIVYLPDADNPRGYFVIDFCLDHYRHIFETDGRCHEGSKKRDEKRDQYMATRGYKTTRIAARDVFHNRGEVALLVKRELGL